MKISYSWLTDYLPTQLSPSEVAAKLTQIGLEVEGIEEVATIPGGLAGLVAGRVLTCEKHPNADRLHVTTVDVGGGEPLRIVCGAPNVAAGQLVVVAQVGVTLYPTDGESFRIKKGKIRGEVSEGMLCAEDEVGLGKGHEGIMVLPPDAKPGSPIAPLFHVESDTVLEIGLTANRADAMSHYGVARDLAALLNLTTPAKAKLPEVKLPPLASSATAVRLGHFTPGLATRYMGLTIRGVKVGPSPAWLQQRLRTIGLAPINSVVDITNYVLHSVGQPLHAFDLKSFASGAVSVMTLPEGTPFTTLDGKARKLCAGDIAICDGTTPLCLGGVFGGLNSGITPSTTDLFIESAVFNPTAIRKTAKRHGLSTDASFRFERGVDPNGAEYALLRAAQLILEIAGGAIDGKPIDYYPDPQAARSILFSPARARQRIGAEIPDGEMLRILDGLEIGHRWVGSGTEGSHHPPLNQAAASPNRATKGKSNATGLQAGEARQAGCAMQSKAEGVVHAESLLELSVPLYRVDVTRPEDVEEEILRIWGYDHVPIPSTIAYTVPAPKDDRARRLQAEVGDFLVGAGYIEIMGLTLTAEGIYSQLKGFSPTSLVHVLNPLSSDLNVLRPTLLVGALDAVARNTARQRPNLKLFEFGRVHHLTGAKGSTEYPLEPYQESTNLAITLTGKHHPETWAEPQRDLTVFDLKGTVENVLGYLGIPLGGLEYTDAPEGIYGHGLTIARKGVCLGHFGEVASGVSKVFGIKQTVLYAELAWDTLLATNGQSKLKFAPLPRFPEVRRDMALLLDQTVTFAQLQRTALKAEPKLLKDVWLFDVYEGEKLPAGKRSYAIGLTLQDPETTLNDSAIDGAVERVYQALVKAWGVERR